MLGVVEALNLPLLSDPSHQMETADAGAAVVGLGLLIADVLIPVPSSLVMIAHGALFGVIPGTLLSLLGSTGASMVGFGIGRRSTLSRYISEQERLRAEALFQKWGWLAIVISRPIPMLAEATVILAGTTGMRWSTLIFSAVIGSLPAAFLYAVTGATAARFDSFLLTFGLVMLLAGLVWVGSYFCTQS